MEKQLTTKQANELFEAILSLKSVKECKAFLRDLCTLPEIEAMIGRFQVAKMVKDAIPYRKISEKTGSSTVTVTRVAHWLHHGMGGYKLALERLKSNNIRLAIQKEGRLKDASFNFVESRGIKFSKKNGRTLLVPCENADVEILYVRHSDIPKYAESGAADFGIVGENVLYENEFNVKQVKRLGFGQCKLAIAVPTKSGIKTVSELKGKRIATSYPNSLRKFLQKQKLNATIIEIKGAVEIAPALGLADAICDITQTGKTLKENNLKPIATLFKSEAVLIESMVERKEKFDFLKKYLTLPSRATQ